MITGIAHVGYNVRNIEEALNFYCNILGLEKAFEKEGPDGDPRIIYLKLDDENYIELYYSKKWKGSENNTGYSHLCLRVDDIYEIADSLKKKGIIKNDAEPRQGLTEYWRFWINDPDGNRIELMQISSGSNP